MPSYSTSYKDIGYFKASIYTDINVYYISATYHKLWEDIDTRSSDSYAKYVPLEATGSVAKTLNDYDYKTIPERVIRYKKFPE